MNINLDDLSESAKSILRVVRITRESSVEGYIGWLKDDRISMNINEAEKAIQELVDKGIAELVDKKTKPGKSVYHISYGLSTSGEFYNADEEYWRARELQDRVCP